MCFLQDWTTEGTTSSFWIDVMVAKTILHNSIVGMVRIYNILDKEIVSEKTVRGFQHALTNRARKACEQGEDIAGMYRARSHL